MRLYRPGFLIRVFYPEAIFRISIHEKVLFITFDDGPHPDTTPLILKILDMYNIKAMFFCKGRASENHSNLIDKIIKSGHQVGNHGYDHLNGWLTPLKSYLDDVDKAAPFTSSIIFRPPYGRLRISQYLKLKEKYKIFFWDIMPYDFDKSMSPSDALRILLKRLRPGSVIVLHEKPGSEFLSYLPHFIEKALDKGYTFDLPEFLTG